MKLITLNTWGGKMSNKFGSFFNKYSDTDIWFFQEVYNSNKEEDYTIVPGYNTDFSFYNTLKRHLNSHKSHFCQVLKDFYGISAFFRPNIEVVEKGEILVARGNWENMRGSSEQDHHRKLQWFEILINRKKVLLMNVHLTHRPEGKLDSDKRLYQSDMIVNFMKMFDCPKILVGDFNLLPDTESIKKIEVTGMRNLIKEYGITSTRTDIYKKSIKFADYVFISPEVKVKNIKVLPDVISDHSPIFLEFDI